MSDQADHLISVAKGAADAAAIGITVGAVMQWLPALAAIFTLVWTGIRIYETNTIQRLLRRNPPTAGE